MALTLVLNGQSRSFDSLSDASSINQLIEELNLKTDRVAIEQNGEIIPRSAWAATPLRQGDRLELVHFVGGGCS